MLSDVYHMLNDLVSDAFRGILRQQAVVLPSFADNTGVLELANGPAMGKQGTTKGDRV